MNNNFIHLLAELFVGWAKRSVPNKFVPHHVGHVATAPLPNLQTKPTKTYKRNQRKPHNAGWTRLAWMQEQLPKSRCQIQKTLNKQRAFSYLEVMAAMIILAISIIPAMQAIQTGIQGAGVHESLTRQHYALIKRMEEVLAEPYGNLLNAAKTAGSAATASSYSDTAGQFERVLVFLALYDADADPFTIVDPDNDGDGDVYSGDSSDLLWLRVELENNAQSMETLVSR